MSFVLAVITNLFSDQTCRNTDRWSIWDGGRMSRHGPGRRLGYTRKRIDVLDLKVWKGINNLNLVVRKRIDDLPFAMFVLNGTDLLNLQIWKGVNDLDLVVRKRLDELNLAIDFRNIGLGPGLVCRLRCRLGLGSFITGRNLGCWQQQCQAKQQDAANDAMTNH